jgi:hypothetical protein
MHSFNPEKINELLHVVQNDLGLYLHRSLHQMKPEFFSEFIGTFAFEDHVLQMRARVKRSTFENRIEENLQPIHRAVEHLLVRTNMGHRGVDRVFLLGDSSLVPVVAGFFKNGCERAISLRSGNT